MKAYSITNHMQPKQTIWQARSWHSCMYQLRISGLRNFNREFSYFVQPAQSQEWHQANTDTCKWGLVDWHYVSQGDNPCQGAAATFTWWSNLLCPLCRRERQDRCNCLDLFLTENLKHLAQCNLIIHDDVIRRNNIGMPSGCPIWFTGPWGFFEGTEGLRNSRERYAPTLTHILWSHYNSMVQIACRKSNTS